MMPGFKPFLLFVLLGTVGHCVDFPEPMKLSLYGERLQVKILAKDGVDVFVQPGRFTYQSQARGTDDTSDTYLVAVVSGRPQIIDRVYGHTAHFEMLDINADGVRELLLFYHSGANQYVLKLYRINEGAILTDHFTPITGDGLSSNLGSITIKGGTIQVMYQQFSPPHGAVNSTESYKLDGLHLVRIGTRLEILPKEK